VVDLSVSSLNDPLKFDLVICDAPCSGSGTWSRTPEQLYFFNEKKISEYSILQKNIVGNALKSLKKDGYFLYMRR
jgi:16S rRNA (cytosine967-C5)-methyltransferase